VLGLGLGALGVAASGCGILSSDIASISFNLPARHYVFDTAAWKLPAATLPSIPCTPSEMCCTLAQQLVGYDCATNPALICDASTCAVSVPVETPPQTIDLKMQVPELSSFGSSQSLANVSISQIKYDVTSTLNLELPPVELFLAPVGVTSTSDPQAHKFGTVPATPAAMLNGTVLTPTKITGTVMLEPDAGATFANYAYHFGTPFQFLGRATVVIRGGDSTPTGSVDIIVSGKVTAKPNL
jgi:hypothetical protein